MKKIFFVFLILSVCCSVFAQGVIDSKVATVELTKPEIISRGQLDKAVKILSQANINRPEKEILDTMIGDVLLKQGAEKEKINVSDDDVLKQIRTELGDSTSRLTEAQIRQIIQERTGLNWATYSGRIKDQIQLQKYVGKMKSDRLNKVPTPTNAEIEKFYEENPKDFLRAKTLTFDHIFIDLTKLSVKEDFDKAKERAFGYEKELKSGAKTFDQIVEFSDDASSKYRKGNFGDLQRDDTRAKQLFGDEFFDAVFSLKENQISGVLKSNVGYHIIRMNKVTEAKMLELSDVISPASNATVRQRIEMYLISVKRNEAFKEAVTELVEDLKKKADIKIYL